MSKELFAQGNKIASSKFYPPPKQGTYYQVEKGKTLFEVSIIAYGYDKTALIIRANTILQMRPLDPIAKLPAIFQDDNIWLPPEVV